MFRVSKIFFIYIFFKEILPRGKHICCATGDQSSNPGSKTFPDHTPISLPLRISTLFYNNKGKYAKN